MAKDFNGIKIKFQWMIWTTENKSQSDAALLLLNTVVWERIDVNLCLRINSDVILCLVVKYKGKKRHSVSEVR